MALKIDLEKAYDFMNWDYIRICLSKFGFNSHWIDLIMSCISSVSFSILVNGKPLNSFTPSRGLRQGVPLSPYIFILCLEPLIRRLNLISLKSKCKNQIGIIPAAKCNRISNPFFADDCLLFSPIEKKKSSEYMGNRISIQISNLTYTIFI